MHLSHEVSQRRYDAFLSSARAGVLCVDFDGTLAPIVEDPRRAHIHPEAADLLEQVSRSLARVAVITGRPVRQAVSLGGLDELGEKLVANGRDLVVLGQYGNERWSASQPRVISPRPPRGLAAMQAELPDRLRRAGLADAHVESKGLSFAVHTRRMEDPEQAQAQLQTLLERMVAQRGLVLEPGRLVIEVRAPGMDKGDAIRSLQRSLRADAMIFIGDDLGDLPAFEAVSSLRRGGMVGFLVCSGSDEQGALVERSDLVVEGPDGVMFFLRGLVADLADHDAARAH